MNWIMVGNYTINLDHVMYLEDIEPGKKVRIHFNNGLSSIDITGSKDLDALEAIYETAYSTWNNPE